MRRFTFIYFCNKHLHLSPISLSSEILDGCGVVNRTLRFKLKYTKVAKYSVCKNHFILIISCNIYLFFRSQGSYCCYIMQIHMQIHKKS